MTRQYLQLRPAKLNSGAVAGSTGTEVWDQFSLPFCSRIPARAFQNLMLKQTKVHSAYCLMALKDMPWNQTKDSISLHCPPAWVHLQSSKHTYSTVEIPQELCPEDRNSMVWTKERFSDLGIAISTLDPHAFALYIRWNARAAGASLFTITYNKCLFVPVRGGISNINISQATTLSTEKTILTCLINLNCLPRLLCFAQHKHLRPWDTAKLLSWRRS